MITVDDVRAVTADLPRSYEAVVRDRIKLRVGRLVYVSFSADESVMGFGFPKDERAALVTGRPDVFLLPPTSDLRYQWVCARMASLEVDEMRELVLDAWSMCVPKTVSRDYFSACTSTTVEPPPPP